MPVADLIRVCSTEDVPAGEVRAFHVEGYDLAVVNLGDGLFGAIESRCPHMGGNLGEGELVDDAVCCAEHGWIFDLETGEAKDRDNVYVATFPVVVQGDEVFIQF